MSQIFPGKGAPLGWGQVWVRTGAGLCLSWHTGRVGSFLILDSCLQSATPLKSGRSTGLSELQFLQLWVRFLIGTRRVAGVGVGMQAAAAVLETPSPSG